MSAVAIAGAAALCACLATAVASTDPTARHRAGALPGAWGRPGDGRGGGDGGGGFAARVARWLRWIRGLRHVGPVRQALERHRARRAAVRGDAPGGPGGAGRSGGSGDAGGSGRYGRADGSGRGGVSGGPGGAGRPSGSSGPGRYEGAGGFGRGGGSGGSGGIAGLGGDGPPGPFGGDRMTGAPDLGASKRPRSGSEPNPGGGHAPWPPSAPGPEWIALPAGVLLALATRSVVPAAAGLAAVPLVRRALRRRAARAAADRAAAAVCALCGTVAGDLRAGRPPHAALADALESADWPRTPELAGAARSVLSAARFGGDVGRALREAARLGDGLRGLAAVAACWQVAVDGGAGLAAALDRVAAALRAEADREDDLRAQLAGPRSTAALLALLPAFGLVLGTALGAHPARVLLHTPAGLACLAAGGLLEWAGLAWTARIVRAAEGRSS